MPHPAHGCATCLADVHPDDVLPGADRDAGLLVHLVDTGPRHDQVAVHRLHPGTQYGRLFEHPADPWRALLPTSGQGLYAGWDDALDLAGGAVVRWLDVSQWQAASYSAAYGLPAAQYRVSLGLSLTDAKLSANASWCHARATARLLTAHLGYHVWYPGNEAGQVARFFMLMSAYLDSRFVAVVDVERWSGAITGDHSDQLNAVCALLALRLGHQRVKVYGNEGDLASIFPRRAAWIGLLKAKYSSQPPTEPWDGWQYTDGSARWPVPSGWPRADAPFGACDHNAFAGTLQQFAARFGVAAVSPAPTPTSRAKGDEVILLNKVTGVGVHLQPGGTAVWLHDGADAAAMHAGGVPMAVVTDNLFQTEVAAAGGGRGDVATTDLRPHLGITPDGDTDGGSGRVSER